MSRDRLDAILNELLSEEDSDIVDEEEDELDLGLTLGTRLFDDDELEAVLSSCTETPQDTSDRVLTSRITLSPDTVQQLETESGLTTVISTKKSETDLSDHQTPIEETRERNLSELDSIEESVRKLVNTGDSERSTSVLDRLKDKLKKAESDWNPDGRPNAYGGMIGGSVSLCTANLTQPIANSLQNEARYGTAQVMTQIALKGDSSLTAVGTSRGMLIVQLSLLSTQGSEDYELFELGDPRSLGTITCLACSPFSEKDRNLIAVGSAEGYISIWDVLARKCVSTISGHSAPICCLSFFVNKSACMLLSSDTKGAFHCHTLTSWVVRTSVSTRVLSEGNRQPLMFNLLPSLRAANDDIEEVSTGLDLRRLVGEGMICLCHPNVCSIGRITPEGRLTVFYQIPKSTEIASDVLPVTSWAPLGRLTYAPHHSPDIDGFIPYGTMALSWMNQLRLLHVPLLGDPSHADSSTRRMPVKLDASDFIRLAHEMQIQSIARWESEEEESFIISTCWLSVDRLAVLRKRGVLSQVMLFNGSLKLMDKVEVDDSIIGMNIRSGASGLTTRLNAVAFYNTQLTMVGGNGLQICKLLEWEEAIIVLTNIGKWLMALHLLVAFHCQATNVEYNPNVGVAHQGIRDVEKINDRICTVLIQLLDALLASTQLTDSDALIELAELAMELCILANRPKVLFDEVFPRFATSEGQAVFLQKLEQSLSCNELTTGIPPEAMQALVEYCCKIGEPEKVERCVLRMDIASLDLNQVIPLCIRHHLFIALLYIFNNSLLRDCTTPALYLVNAIVLSENKDKAYDYGMNLLLYIRCCLHGELYPPGFAQVDRENVLLTKQKVLGFMLFTKVEDLKKASEVMLRDARKEEAEASSSESLMKLSDPYPVLQCLLSVNAGILVGLLSEALESWECVEKDLLEAYTDGKVEEMESVRSVTQVIVDALVGLLERFPEDKEALLNYICRCVASGKAVVAPDTALTLLEHLSMTSPRNDDDANYTETVEERLFCGIVRSVGIELQSNRKSVTMFTYLEGQKALGLATNANLLSASALLHHLFQDYESALCHYLLVGRSYSTRPFTYFEKSVAQFMEYHNQTELQKLKKAALSIMSELASLNPECAAAMVMKHFPKDQEAVIQGLHGSRSLLYKYLKSAMDAALSKVQSSLEVELSSDSNQLLTKMHCTLYVNLMCEYDPSSVLPFLQSYDRLVDVQVCKQDCLKFGLHDAAAYLLERECDIMGALKILIQKIQNVHTSMEKTIVSKNTESLFGIHSRQLSLAAILRVSDFPDERLNEFPEDVRQAQSALSSAVKLCRKNSLLREKRTTVDEKRRIETLQLWFSLLLVYIEALRGLPRLIKKRLKETSYSAIGSQHSLPLKPVDQFKDYPRLAYLRDIYNALMDEVITAMADYVPLVDVAQLVISEHSNDKFGDFRSTLLGLISAYNHEQNILTSIRRLLSVDAYHVLNDCYKKRTQALKIEKMNPPSTSS